MTADLRIVGGNWLAGTVHGLQVEAKVFAEPSDFGIALDRRISKLWISTPDDRVTLYRYDRGDDVAGLTEAGLAPIVRELGKAIDRFTEAAA